MHPDSIAKTAFVTPLGQFEFLMLPMGLHSAPSSFQSIMTSVLAGLEHKALVYIDDVIIFSKDFDSHVKDVQEVLQRLRDENLKVCPPKCEFFRTELLYLGFTINREGITTNPKLVSAIKNMPIPQTIKQVETFIGKTVYYSRFIKDFSKVAYPLMSMKKKNAIFQMGEEEIQAFRKLKDALCEAPVLKHPDFERRFYIATDASGFGLGGVLFQRYEDGEHPVRYASRTLKGPEFRYSTSEREALAVRWAIRQFSEYIEGTEFTVITDHQALLALNDKVLNSPRLELIRSQLGEYRFVIEYKKGKDHQNADTLSRYPVIPLLSERSKESQTNSSMFNNYDETSNFSSECPKFRRKRLRAADVVAKIDDLRPPVMDFLQTPRRESVNRKFRNLPYLQEQVREFKQIRDYLNTGKIEPTASTEIIKMLSQFFIDEEDRLARVSETGTKQICVPLTLRNELIYYAHSLPSVGHFGIGKTTERLYRNFWWPGITKDVALFVYSCPLCKTYKMPPRPGREMLGDRPPVRYPWYLLHMDIWKPGIVSNSGNKHVLGVIDAYTKFVILAPMPDETSSSVIEALMTHVFLPYGLPRLLISDGGTDFKSKLMEELLVAFGVEHRITVPYRPQSNGLIERVFRTIRPVTAILTHKARKSWDTYLPWVQLSYNSAFHNSIKTTPFELFFGRKPAPAPPELEDMGAASNVQIRNRWRLGLEAAKRSLQIEQEKSKAWYDAARARPQNIQIGDFVLVRLSRPPKGDSHKLAPKFVGPYRVRERTGPILHLDSVHGNLPEKYIHSDRVVLCAHDYPNIHSARDLLLPFEENPTILGLEQESPE